MCVPGGPGSGGADARAMVLPGRAASALALAFPSAQAHRLGLSFHSPEFASQPDKLTVDVQFIYELFRRGIWTTRISSRAQGVDSVRAVERPLMSGACRRNPQHFGVCTQVPGFSAQVIHSLCTEKPVASLLPGAQAAAVRGAGAGMTRSMPNARIWPGCGGDRPRRRLSAWLTMDSEL